MHWEVLIIPLIALGVWILGTIFRGEEERPGSPVRRSGAPGRPAQRRPVTDLDQFLEEARRRREAGQRQAPVPAPRSAPVPPRPPTPPRRPVRERSQPAQQPRPTRTVTRQPEAPPPLTTVTAAPVNLPEVIPVAEVVRPGKGGPEPVFEVTAIAALSEKGGMKETVAPLTQQVRDMLRQPQSAALAFILREVLDRPLSRRRR